MDWNVIYDEIKRMKGNNYGDIAQQYPSNIAIEENKDIQPESSNPNLVSIDTERKWWQVGDAITRQDEILEAILLQLQSMATLQAGPVFPPTTEEVIPTEVMSVLNITAREQLRTKQLLEGFNFITGQGTIQTAGTSVELISTIKTYYVIIRADINNTGTVYLGSRGVSTTTGYAINAGEAIALSIDNTKKQVWMNGTAANDVVSWIALVD